MTTRRVLTIATLLSAGALALPGAAPAAYPGRNGEIAFTSTQDGGARHIFAATGPGFVDLTGASSSAADTQPKFSPDGREILFTRSAPGLPNTEIFVMGANGTQLICPRARRRR
jgi:Tol biopolymer transport system component